MRCAAAMEAGVEKRHKETREHIEQFAAYATQAEGARRVNNGVR